MKAQTIAADSLLTSHQVGSLLQVNPSSINKWVKDGRIRAFRTPGGHRRIRAADLVVFLREHEMPVPRSLQSATRRRLLVVDDDPRQLASLARLFKPYQNFVDLLVVDNGIDGLVQLGRFQPQLAILDIFMPQVDGLEVLKRLKANAETQKIDIIIASGQLTPELEAKALAAGARLCMHKPIDIARVLTELGIELEERYAAAP